MGRTGDSPPLGVQGTAPARSLRPCPPEAQARRRERREKSGAGRISETGGVSCGGAGESSGGWQGAICRTRAACGGCRWRVPRRGAFAGGFIVLTAVFIVSWGDLRQKTKSANARQWPQIHRSSGLVPSHRLRRNVFIIGDA